MLLFESVVYLKNVDKNYLFLISVSFTWLLLEFFYRAMKTFFGSQSILDKLKEILGILAKT